MKKQISMIMLLVVIGAVLLSGCMSQSDNGDEVAPIDNKTTDPVSEEITGAGEVAGEEVSDEDIPKTEGLKEYKVGRELYATGTVDKGGIATIYIENRRSDWRESFPILRIHLLVTVKDENAGGFFFSIWEENEYIYPGETKIVKIDLLALPEMVNAKGYDIEEIKIDKISLQ